MGWSCSMVASNIMNSMTKASLAMSGEQNVYQYKGQWYMWEISRREHRDGSITGSISRFLGDRHAPTTRVLTVGHFRIDGNTGFITGSHGITKLVGLPPYSEKERYESVKQPRFVK